MTREQAVERVRHAGLVPMPVYSNTFDLARDVLDRDVPGDFAECGVFAGAQVALMALAAEGHPNLRGRRFHLFDSFEGIPMAGPQDTEQPGVGPVENGSGELVTSGVSACSMKSVQVNMARWGVDRSRLVYHEGWFQDTVPHRWHVGRSIALLRLDGDLYDSTFVCLRHLYPHLSDGGICIVDDCNLAGCLRAVEDYFGGKPPERAVVPDGGGCEWWIKA